ncbi:MAG: Cysteine desulfurase [Candidatus Wolfebacteria bacterium GW2011_GWA2_42_10]|uniref:cysteine desulfurase n=2 Tax=Candidatus Wolfeibacteriota TaxID=1752735 RepID=A0A0G0ZTE0_9BACT|nr:MAG: Cysteine desulfurase [Candidatus Wolfebacteria bacterium GW2011_GWB1_41_12]KKS25251.1 MAG: Cysteine desulfurase [Candidatus Wolfebacteria bacterium GW2011_GWA2_42_10]KKT56691.1 MAG: Cysteine desulfurase [Candidatus Wolfebacteria bacterium GW2011_GWA1_44_24]
MKKIYFDCAATTPIDSTVKKAMLPYFSEKFGNPSSLHSFGQEVMAAIDDSREKIARSIGANFHEIIFTGSATEANNLALRGAMKFFNNQKISPLRIIISAIEHESILETARSLEKEGIEIIYLPVNKQGIVDLKKLKDSLNERTILISIMYANNEIGTIQPIAEIAKIISEFKKGEKISFPYPLFHTDAVQAFQFLNCDVEKLSVDLMTLSGHKIYGPKGVGALFMKHIPNSEFQILNSIITGGGQEFGLRSGTENVPAIVGFAKAAELAVKNRKKESEKIGQLTNYFWQKIKKIFPKTEINGSRNRLPNILNVYFSNRRAEDLLIKLDLAGVAVSSGSACSSRSTKLSYVLKAVGCDDKRIKSSLRFSFGKFTTKKEIDEVIKIMENIL